jgi:hypothetical protein
VLNVSREHPAYLIVELVHIQANLFNVVRHTQVHARDELEDHEHDDAEGERPGEDRADFCQLQTDLTTIAIDGTVNDGWNAIQRTDFCGGENAADAQLVLYTHSVPLITYVRKAPHMPPMP